LERWKDAVLRLVPAAWHPLVEDGTLVTVYPSEELRQMLNRLQADFDARLKALREAYRHHLAAIKGSLPQGVIQLVEKTPHDARIRSIERPAPERLVMTLDCDGAMFYDEDIRLAFTGVRRVEGELPPPGSLWLTEEVFLAEDAGEGFELHILFDGPLAEFTLSAADVEVSFLG
jgi:hypothetical protein